METQIIASSPWLDPRFLLAVVVAVIGAVAWLLRLESKVNGTDKEQTRLAQSIEDTWKDIEHHRLNSEIHFDQKLASRVEMQQKERMDRMQSDIQEIKVLVKEIAAK